MRSHLAVADGTWAFDTGGLTLGRGALSGDGQGSEAIFRNFEPPAVRASDREEKEGRRGQEGGGLAPHGT